MSTQIFDIGVQRLLLFVNKNIFPSYDEFDEETYEIKQHLLKIISHGVYTQMSQPGSIEEFKHGTNFQRAFIVGFMKLPLLKKLVDGLVLTELLVIPIKQNTVGTSSIPISAFKLVDGKIEIETTAQFNYSDRQIIHDYKLMGQLDISEELDNLALAYFVDPVWGRPTYLFDKIIEILES